MPAPIAVLNDEASKAVTVLSALYLGNDIADGFARVNTLCPMVVPPNAVLAKGAVIAPVPPFSIATVPVTFPAVVAVVAVLAFPVKAPVNPVDVTEVSPVMVAGKLNTGVAPPVDAI